MRRIDLRQLGAGETLMPFDEVVGFLRAAGRRREQEFDDHQAIARLTWPQHRAVTSQSP